MYKMIRESERLPKWLKILIDIALTLTCVYWICFLLYKILDVFRLFLHTMTEKKVYWIALGIILTCAIVTLCILEFSTDVKPFTIMGQWFVSVFDEARQGIADVISPKN